MAKIIKPGDRIKIRVTTLDRAGDPRTETVTRTVTAMYREFPAVHYRGVDRFIIYPREVLSVYPKKRKAA